MNREQIVEILEDHLEWLHENEIIFKNEIPLIADRLEQQPISEKRIQRIAKKVADEHGGRLWGDYYRAAKAALEELNK